MVGVESRRRLNRSPRGRFRAHILRVVPVSVQPTVIQVNDSHGGLKFDRIVPGCHASEANRCLCTVLERLLRRSRGNAVSILLVSLYILS